MRILLDRNDPGTQNSNISIDPPTSKIEGITRKQKQAADLDNALEIKITRTAAELDYLLCARWV